MNKKTSSVSAVAKRGLLIGLVPVMLVSLVLAPMPTGVAWADEMNDDPHADDDQGRHDGESGGSSGHHGPSLTDDVIPLLSDEDLPKRTRPLVEAGAPLLGPGKLRKGIKLPTGAIWTPALWIYGDYRTSVNYVDSGIEDEELLEWPNRLDLLFNFQFSGTERLMVGFQPLQQDGRFTNYTYLPEGQRGWTSEANLQIATIFFEGEIGEIFPRADPMDQRGLDIGFAVGRQLIEFQGGIMVNDLIDSVGIVRNGSWLPGISKIRTTFLFGWNDLNRGDGIEDESALMIAVFNELDTVRSTYELDVAYVDGDQTREAGGSGLYVGIGATQRFGLINTTFRLNGSLALDERTTAVDDGLLATAQVSTSFGASHNVFYTNAFLGIERYTSASRDPTTGGPLGSIGLLFGAVGLGRWPPALGNSVREAYGLAVGYQWFWDTDKTQFVLEAGGRESTAADGEDALALGGRLQRKLGRRYLVQFDGYVTKPRDNDARFGLRSEFRINF